MTKTLNDIKPGDHLRFITGSENPASTIETHGFKVGQIVEVKSVIDNKHKTGSGLGFFLVEDAKSTGPWDSSWFEVPVLTYNVGDTVRLTDKYGPHRGFKPGDPATVTRVFPDCHTGSGVGLHIDATNTVLWDANWWVPAEPVVPDGTLRAALTHDTSKTYAAKARSKKLLTEAHNAILEAASSGEVVDVYEFRKAATSALSAATTRAGQSMARRDWAREARHLIYWADSLIDNHAKGLPVYEGGPRSPRIAELEAEVAKLRAEGSPEVQRAIRAAKDAIDALNRKVEWHKARTEASTKVNRTVRDRLNAARKQVEAVEAERDILASVLLYVQTQSTDREFISRVLGYWDGLQDGS